MVKQILIALDQLLNALCGGWADETISAHAYRAGWTWRARLINTIFRDPNHCADSYTSEKTRAQLPPEYRLPLSN